MKDTLLYIVSKIVEHYDEVSVEEKRENDKTIFVLHVHPDDMGKIIGKKGRIITAIRDLIKLAGAKNQMSVDVLISENNIPSEAIS